MYGFVLSTGINARLSKSDVWAAYKRVLTDLPQFAMMSKMGVRESKDQGRNRLTSFTLSTAGKTLQRASGCEGLNSCNDSDAGRNQRWERGKDYTAAMDVT